MKNRIDYFDSLRGIAAFSVVIFHIINSHWDWMIEAKLSLFLFNGADAVSFFFVLSGLVLSMKYFKNDSILQNFPIKKYFYSRFFRLMPVYWFVLFFIYIFQNKKELLSLDFFKNILFNKHHLFEQILLIRGWTDSIILPAWSLGVELIISLFLPVFIIAFKINRNLIYFVLLLILIGNKNYIPIFLFHFLLGLIIAYHFKTIESNKIDFLEKNKKLILVFSILFYSYRQFLNILAPLPQKVNYILNDFLQLDPFFITSIGAFGIICVCISSLKIQNVLQNKLLLFLGKISYPMYLIHCFFIGIYLEFISKIETTYGNLFAFVSMSAFVIICTIIFSYLIHIFIENPIIDFGKKFCSKL